MATSWRKEDLLNKYKKLSYHRETTRQLYPAAGTVNSRTRNVAPAPQPPAEVNSSLPAGRRPRPNPADRTSRQPYARLFLSSLTDRALHWTRHLLYNCRLAKVVSTLSANKPCDIRGGCFQTTYSFKVICFCIIRKPLKAFIIIHISNGHTPQDVWEKIMLNVNNNKD